MTPIPLDKIRWFSWRSHKSALWWLRLLYCRSKFFQEVIQKFSLKKTIIIFLKLWLNYIPYIFLISALGRIFLYGILEIETGQELNSLTEVLIYHSKKTTIGILGGVATGIAGGIVFGLVSGITGRIFGTAEGIAVGIVVGIAFESTLVISIGIGLAVGIALGIAIGIAGGIGSERNILFVGGLTITVIFGFGIVFGIAEGFAFGITFITSVLRLYYYPINFILVWPKPKGKWYPYHPVAWDDMCLLPFFHLDRLLVAYVPHNEVKGLAEIERLISNYPSQRMQALKAFVRVLARMSTLYQDLSELNKIAKNLPEGDKGFLKETPAMREKIIEIACLQTRLNTIDRPIFKEPLTQLICEKIRNFRNQIAGFHEPLVSEFRDAANKWLQIAQQQLTETRSVTEEEPTPQVFRAGDPVNRQQEAFVPRYAVMGELEKQVMLSTGCPGLVVYARRRTGKSTLLRNLSGFIPGNILPVFNSMQEPQLFASLKHWTGAIAQSIKNRIPGFKPSSKTPEDLPEFFTFLSEWNTYLEKEDKRILLEIDEYENIDLKIGETVFPEDLLTTIRESIQSHRRFTWIFAGSHEIIELKNAPWTSYLVSARTLEVPMFTAEETRLLLTEPLKYSTLWDKDDPRRPRFTPEFWGEDGIERIHIEAGGWPHLVQLIAETIVDLVNDEDTREVNAELMERALDRAIVSGHNVLYELVRRECFLPSEWEYLSTFCKSEFQPQPDDEAIYRSLRRRLLVEEENGQWRLRVPLMLRWLRQRG